MTLCFLLVKISTFSIHDHLNHPKPLHRLATAALKGCHSVKDIWWQLKVPKPQGKSPCTWPKPQHSDIDLSCRIQEKHVKKETHTIYDWHIHIILDMSGATHVELWTVPKKSLEKIVQVTSDSFPASLPGPMPAWTSHHKRCYLRDMHRQ